MHPGDSCSPAESEALDTADNTAPFFASTAWPPAHSLKTLPFGLCQKAYVLLSLSLSSAILNLKALMFSSAFGIDP